MGGGCVDAESAKLASSVALVGGGIKGAVAAARYAASDDLVLLHVNFGQRSWSAEAKAVSALARSFPSARVMSVDLPHLYQFEDQVGEGAGVTSGARAAGTATNVVSPAATSAALAPAGAPVAITPGGRAESWAPSPTALLGLMSVLLSMGLQCALRVGASRVVVGLSRLNGSSGVGLPVIEGQPQRLREFLHSFNLAAEALPAQRSSVLIETPLMDTSYAEVVRLAFHFELPVGELWTCEDAGPKPCTRCEPCTRRARAFVEARSVDALAAPRPTPAGLAE